MFYFKYWSKFFQRFWIQRHRDFDESVRVAMRTIWQWNIPLCHQRHWWFKTQPSPFNIAPFEILETVPTWRENSFFATSQGTYQDQLAVLFPAGWAMPKSILKIGSLVLIFHFRFKMPKKSLYEAVRLYSIKRV
jgi:hypothetical protein